MKKKEPFTFHGLYKRIQIKNTIVNQPMIVDLHCFWVYTIISLALQKYTLESLVESFKFPYDVYELKKQSKIKLVDDILEEWSNDIK